MKNQMTQPLNELSVIGRPLPYRAVSFSDWGRLASRSDRQLREATNNYTGPEWRRRVLAAASYEQSDPTDVIPVDVSDETSAVPNEDAVVRRLDRTLQQLHPIPRMLVAALVKGITIEDGPKAGYFDRDNWTISIRALSSEHESVFDPVAHEIGHALHIVSGVWVTDPTAVDNRQRPREEWVSGNIQRWPDEPSHWRTIGQRGFDTAWETYVNRSMGSVTKYQERNPEELFACAFEAWISNRAVLTAEQPLFKMFFDRWCGPREQQP